LLLQSASRILTLSGLLVEWHASDLSFLTSPKIALSLPF
jgi:hypothetical protein